jgi:Cof subfamily protein (haloacid dehalogenase superfamily)
MKLADCRLVVSDLDGTLTPYGTNDLSGMTVKTVAALRKTGVEFTIATGRSWKQAQPVVAQLGITCPVIVQTGALVIDPTNGRPIRTQPLRPELAQKLRQMKQFFALDQFSLARDGLFYTTGVSSNGGQWLCNCGEICKTVKQWRHHQAETIKHLYIGAEVELKRLGARIKAENFPKPNLFFWPPDSAQMAGDWLLEVFDPLASKGQALQWLTGHLGIALENVIAFGDGHNDLDMLEQAGLGVAIEGCDPQITAVSGAVTTRPEADGVARFLKSLAAGVDDRSSHGVA